MKRSRLTEMGTVATWLATINRMALALRRFKQLMEERRLERDHRFALALLALNEHLPLSLRGDIQTPNGFWNGRRTPPPGLRR